MASALTHCSGCVRATHINQKNIEAQTPSSSSLFRRVRAWAMAAAMGAGGMSSRAVRRDIVYVLWSSGGLADRWNVRVRIEHMCAHIGASVYGYERVHRRFIIRLATKCARS